MWKIIGVRVCVPPWGIRTALCVVDTTIICEQSLWIPLTLLETDSRHCSKSSTSVFGVIANTMFGPEIQRVFVLGHTLSPLLSGILLFRPLRAMETRSLSLSALSYSFSVSFSHYSIFYFTLVVTTIALIRNRKSQMLNWTSRWLSRSRCLCVLVSTHGCRANEVNSAEQK